MIRSVSQTLYRPTEKLSIKLSVGLLDSGGRESFYSLYATDKGEYLTFNTSANIIIQYKDKTQPYDRNQTIHINDGNIFHWNKELTKFYKKMQQPNLFKYYKSGTVECCATDDDKHTISLRGGEFVEFEPSTIFDKNGNALPGIIMRINVKANSVDLSIDEFESMMYKFSKIDISRESMQLILARLIVDSKMKIETSDRLPDLREVMVESGEPDLTGLLSEEREKVEDRRRPTSIFDNSPKSLDDLMK